MTGILDGLMAVPFGLWVLLTHRGLKRWMVPPALLTGAVSVAVLVGSFRWLDGLMDAHARGELAFERDVPGWLEGADWVESAWLAGLVAAEWSLNLVWSLLTSQGFALIGYFLVGSLILWYCFSIVYEALAGPFLDEVQARLEIRWFRSDPRSRLERPNDIPPERCLALLIRSGVIAVALVLALLFVPGLAWGWALLGVPLGLLPAFVADRRFGPWCAWVARVEGRALLASLQASVLTTFFLVVAFPLYFVPFFGYFLFAGVTGFATAVGLSDIPFERRGWPFRMRVAFVVRHLLPFIAFGIVAGALLAIPIVGPLLMVPSASIGGLWLICRLDKRHTRPAEAPRIQAGSDAAPLGATPLGTK
ncbi:MAG: EI24 domain-containing protein [Planctomycetota bacterium]